MILSTAQIKNAGLIRKGKPRYFTGGCYLTIGKIVDLHTKKEVSEYSLPPQGMVYAISSESLILPENVLGYTTVKNGLSNQALLCLNIGIVDKGFRQPIGSVIINFGNSE